jgi:murein DD-endopeptidase MepM/ murein hydrolase activator NlpD
MSWRVTALVFSCLSIFAAGTAPVPMLQFPPIEGLKAKDLFDSFDQMRGASKHEAIDIMEPRLTPVHAVVDGVITKLFLSKAGGNTIYLFDTAGVFCYYYAHLDGYAAKLAEGQHVTRGDVIGYVGSSGNASPNAPHLHFTIYAIGPDKHWWHGTPINAYPFLLQLLQSPASR